MLKREGTQSRVLMLKRDPEVCVSKNNMTITLAENARFVSEIRTRPLRLTKDARFAFGLRCDPSFGMRLASEARTDLCVWEVRV